MFDNSFKKEINSDVFILFFFIWLIIKLSASISKLTECSDISLIRLVFNLIDVPIAMFALVENDISLNLNNVK